MAADVLFFIRKTKQKYASVLIFCVWLICCWLPCMLEALGGGVVVVVVVDFGAYIFVACEIKTHTCPTNGHAILYVSAERELFGISNW